ncbi:MAG: thymidine phosphorylase [Planctomycetes bacterium]|nr:thymidine phosphorylase [Planctomycetota bacterium]
MREHPATLIKRKRAGQELSDEQIRDLVDGVCDGSLEDAQLGAFLMAVCLQGMSAREAATLTLAMRDSGRVLDLAAIPGVKVDKHSTGGVGDKISLFLAPLVAAAGVPVPMISGRGLGHTGGTLDKLAAIPGYTTAIEPEEFVAVLRDCGYVMAGASADIAPADRRMYATRDVTGTVESVPLITASILSKKLAEGIDGLVLDVKCGRAAFMQTREDAEELTRSLVDVGRAADKRVTALVTDMDTPLGNAVGNALEVAEIVECLHGRGPRDVVDLTFALAAEMLVLAGSVRTPDEARPRLEQLVEDGSALDACRANVVRQGGDPAFLDDPKALGCAPVVAPFEPKLGRDVFVADIDPLEVGLAAVDLGAGRRHSADDVDPHVGIVLHKKVGDVVRDDEALFTVHARDHAAAEAAVVRVARAVGFADARPPARPLVLTRVD